MTVHMCPPTGGFVTPCCAKSPFDLPIWEDRITLDPELVTCKTEATPEEVRRGELHECFRNCPWCDTGPVGHV